MTLGQTTLAAQRQQQVAALPPITISLDDLLAEVSGPLLKAEVAKSERKALAKADKEEAAGVRDFCGLTKAQRLALRARLLAYEAEAEWLPLAFVAHEETQNCAHCGGSTTHFIGLYQQQKQRIGKKAERFVLWEPQDAAGSALPRFLHSTESIVQMCTHCRWDGGFAEPFLGTIVNTPEVMLAKPEEVRPLRLENANLTQTLEREMRINGDRIRNLEKEVLELGWQVNLATGWPKLWEAAR